MLSYFFLLILWDMITHFYPLHIHNALMTNLLEATFEGGITAVVYPILFNYFSKRNNTSSA
jgi:hypothetical protein